MTDDDRSPRWAEVELPPARGPALPPMFHGVALSIALRDTRRAHLVWPLVGAWSGRMFVVPEGGTYRFSS